MKYFIVMHELDGTSARSVFTHSTSDADITEVPEIFENASGVYQYSCYSQELSNEGSEQNICYHFNYSHAVVFDTYQTEERRMQQWHPGSSVSAAVVQTPGRDIRCEQFVETFSSRLLLFKVRFESSGGCDFYRELERRLLQGCGNFPYDLYPRQQNLAQRSLSQKLIHFLFIPFGISENGLQKTQQFLYNLIKENRDFFFAQKGVTKFVGHNAISLLSEGITEWYLKLTPKNDSMILEDSVESFFKKQVPLQEIFVNVRKRFGGASNSFPGAIVFSMNSALDRKNFCIFGFERLAFSGVQIRDNYQYAPVVLPFR